MSRPGATLLLVVVLLAACATTTVESSPSAAAPPPEPGLVDGDGMVADLATIVRPIVPRWGPGPGGTAMTDDWGEHPVVLEPPVPVSVLAGPVDAGGTAWYRVYVLPDTMRWPSDFTAWVPAETDGEPVLALTDPIPCPEGDVADLATLTPTGRVTCFGDRTLRFEARSWLPGHWVPYETEPAWLGTEIDDPRSISLFEPGGGELPRPPDPRVRWIDGRVHPEVAVPPVGVTLLVEAQFDHPDVDGCRRLRDRSGPPPQPATAGLPDEDAAASAAWCRGQLVVTSWEIILGPEGRPPVAGEVQLHRTTFEGGECGGVGMPPLQFRMDPLEADPIWLEPVGGGGRSIPVFGHGFRATSEPELAVIGPRGEVVARDGTPLDPDAPLGPYAVCPGGEVVTITQS